MAEMTGRDAILIGESLSYFMNKNTDYVVRELADKSTAVVVVTPFLYADGDNVVLYVFYEDDDARVTDMGTTSALSMITILEKDVPYVTNTAEMIANSLNVKYMSGDLNKVDKKEKIGSTIFDVASACMLIDRVTLEISNRNV